MPPGAPLPPIVYSTRVRGVAALVAVPNVQNDGAFTMKGLQIVDYTEDNSTPPVVQDIRLVRFAGESIVRCALVSGPNLLDDRGRDTSIVAVRAVFRGEQFVGATLPSMRRSDVRLTVWVADDQFAERGARSRVISGEEMNEFGWFNVGIAGRYGWVAFEMMGMARYSLRELMGLEVELDTKD